MVVWPLILWPFRDQTMAEVKPELSISSKFGLAFHDSGDLPK